MINLSLQSKDFENKLITALVIQYNLISGNLIINQNRGIRGPEDTKSKKNEKVILAFVSQLIKRISKIKYLLIINLVNNE